MVEQRIAAVLGGFNHTPVLSTSQRESVGATDPAAEQLLDGAGHLPGIVLGGLAKGDLLLGSRLADARDGAVPAMKDGHVLGHRDLVGSLVQRLEVDVLGAAIGVAQLAARELKVGSRLDQRQDAPVQPGHSLGRGRGEPPRAPEVCSRVLPPVRTGEIDQLPSP